MSQNLGKASVRPEVPVYILNSGSIVGTKEGQGPLGLLFDMVGNDDMFGCETWEEAESSLQKTAVQLAMEKAKVKAEDVKFIFAGDLLGQSIASSFGISSYQIPMLGVYGACSTCGESLTVGTMTIAGGFADKVVCVTSSHFASAEKEFRFPLEYGNQRPLSATWTLRQQAQSKDYGNDGGKNSGLWAEGFHEYGSMYGTCGGIHAGTALYGFWQRTFRL